MKRHLTISGLLVMLLTGLVSAQERSKDPTDLTVLEKTWQKTFYVPGRNENIMQPNEDLIRQTRMVKREIENRDRALPNQTTENRLPLLTPGGPTGRPVNIYIYKIKVQNTGGKRIKAVDWEYQFIRSDTQEVLGSHQIFSQVKILPGATKVIQAKSPKQPTKLVSIDQLQKKYRSQFEERVIIHRIQYSDGTVWRRKP